VDIGRGVGPLDRRQSRDGALLQLRARASTGGENTEEIQRYRGWRRWGGEVVSPAALTSLGSSRLRGCQAPQTTQSLPMCVCASQPSKQKKMCQNTHTPFLVPPLLTARSDPPSDQWHHPCPIHPHLSQGCRPSVSRSSCTIYASTPPPSSTSSPYRISSSFSPCRFSTRTRSTLPPGLWTRTLQHLFTLQTDMTLGGPGFSPASDHSLVS